VLENIVKSILHPSFRYTPACNTDIRKTFARIRREQAAQQRIAASVTPINRSTTNKGK
jgi:hypothetical protein